MASHILGPTKPHPMCRMTAKLLRQQAILGRRDEPMASKPLTVAYTGPILCPETPKKVAQVQRFCLDPTRLRPYRGTGLSAKLQGHIGPGHERLTIAQQLQCSDVVSTLSSRVAFCSSDVFRRPPAQYLLHRLASAELDRHHALRVPKTSTATEVSAGLVERVTFYNEDNGFYTREGYGDEAIRIDTGAGSMNLAIVPSRDPSTSRCL